MNQPDMFPEAYTFDAKGYLPEEEHEEDWIDSYNRVDREFTREYLAGFSDDGDLVTIEANQYNIVLGFNTYYHVGKDQTVDSSEFLLVCDRRRYDITMRNGAKLSKGMRIPPDYYAHPDNITEDELDSLYNVYPSEAYISCDNCQLYVDTEDYGHSNRYDCDENGFMLCGDCMDEHEERVEEKPSYEELQDRIETVLAECNPNLPFYNPT